MILGETATPKVSQNRRNATVLDVRVHILERKDFARRLKIRLYELFLMKIVHVTVERIIPYLLSLLARRGNASGRNSCMSKCAAETAL